MSYNGTKLNQEIGATLSWPLPPHGRAINACWYNASRKHFTRGQVWSVIFQEIREANLFKLSLLLSVMLHQTGLQACLLGKLLLSTMGNTILDR